MTQSDPSMDEILASIRRIIAEEEGDTAQPASAGKTSIMESPATEETTIDEERGAETDVLELTEAIEDEDSPLLLTEEIVDDPEEVVEEVHHEVEQSVEESEPIIKESEEAIEEAELATEPQEGSPQEPEYELEAPAIPPSSRDTALISEQTERRAMEALRVAMAASAPAPEPEAEPEPAPAAPQLDEEQLKALMAPMVREWLDQNLPDVVERVVREEVTRLVDRLRDV